MSTTWKKNIIEGLDNKNKLDVSNVLSGTNLTIKNTLDTIKGPILNSTPQEKLPPNVQHETALYTHIRENIAIPFVRSFKSTNTDNAADIK
jgi:hypothetical protein